MISAEKRKNKVVFINPNSPKAVEKLLRKLAVEKLVHAQKVDPPPQ